MVDDIVLPIIGVFYVVISIMAINIHYGVL